MDQNWLERFNRLVKEEDGPGGIGDYIRPAQYLIDQGIVKADSTGLTADGESAIAHAKVVDPGRAAEAEEFIKGMI